MVVIIFFNLTACEEKAVSQEVLGKLAPRAKISGQIAEVAPPVSIQELRRSLEVHQPQVSIVAPQAEEVLSDNIVKVKLQVKDLPVFQNPQLNLGPHLQVILDNQPYLEVYDPSQPVTFSDLTPGTHTLRVFASFPWGESFKNVGAYKQLKFHVFTKTEDSSPDFSLPVLTYNQPQGSYGAEPILLDFYLNNAPLSVLNKDNSENPLANWRIRCTINGESFVFDRWQSVYLKGFKPGKNWIELEFLDGQGNPVINGFNSTTRTITYDPNGKDTLARIFRGELSLEQVRGIVDPKYTVKVSQPQSTPEVKPNPEIQPKPKVKVIPEAQPTPTQSPVSVPTPQETPKTIPVPQITPSPSVEATPQQPKETPKTIPQTEVTSQPIPEAIPTPSVNTTVPTPEDTSVNASPEPSPSPKPPEPETEQKPISSQLKE